MTQVRTRVGCKEPRRYNGSASHNSVAEGEFLSRTDFDNFRCSEAHYGASDTYREAHRTS